MEHFLQMVGLFGLLAAALFAAGSLAAWGLRRNRRRWLAPGGLARLKTSDRLYRTRYLGLQGGSLAFAAPLEQGHFAPISVGESVDVEAPIAAGIIQFRTRVAARDSRSHTLLLETPEQMRRADRRGDRRYAADARPVELEERHAWLLDLSRCGARLARNGPLSVGERVSLSLRPHGEVRFAWVLECSPRFEPGPGSHVARLRFEEPLDQAEKA
jgi:hypothetical protein